MTNFVILLGNSKQTITIVQLFSLIYRKINNSKSVSEQKLFFKQHTRIEQKRMERNHESDSRV